MTNFAILGIPLACDRRTGGMAEAPAALRRAGLIQALIPLGGLDQGDAFPVAIVGPDPAAFVAHSADSLHAVMSAAGPLLVLGGDCTIAPGVMAAAQVWEPLLLWLDAHGDCNTVDTTPSGYWPGMPLARVMGLNTPLGPAEAILPGQDIAIVGARDLDPGEGENALRVGATVLTGDLPALDRLPTHRANVWIHLDLDVLDPTEMPAINYPVPGGWRKDQLVAWVGVVAQRYRVVGLEITAFDPRRDPDGQVARDLVALITSLAQAALIV